MFVLPHAQEIRSAEIAAGWASSLAMGAGQFCTNPGIAILQSGETTEEFITTARRALAEVDPQTMLTDGIARAYVRGGQAIANVPGVRSLLAPECSARMALPHLYATSAQEFLANDLLANEVFGPLGIVVIAQTAEEMRLIAARFEGQLTATLHMADGDGPLARELLPTLERKAGRVLVNGFPTGVEVCDAMVHGGPYPASTNFGATSVGTLSIRRFLRPVCYQNMPVDLLPEDLRD